MTDYLFDLPRSFFENGFVEDGQFNRAKAEEYGYSAGQIEQIETFLELSAPPPTVAVEIPEE